jgi:NADH-quinone oxidoreductase subunit J
MMTATLIEYVLLVLLMATSLGVLFLRNTVHACLSFLGTLLTLAAFYAELKAPFIAMSQVLIYAGAILVLFMFVIILFQDAHHSIADYRSKCHPLVLYGACLLFACAFFAASWPFLKGHEPYRAFHESFGSVMSIGKALYIEFFFPFEGVIFIFLVSLVVALYIGKRES